MSVIAPTAPLDVLVVGGGPVGACAGVLLLRALAALGESPRVAILEPNRPGMPEPGTALDARVSAISRASERILERAGAWSRIVGPRVQSYERMRVWHRSIPATSPEVLVFDAAAAAEPDLGHIAENRLVQAALIAAFEQAGGHLISGELSGVRIEDSRVEADTTAGKLSARLLVGADGARSAVREVIGITADVASYAQIAVVANVATERPHERTAYQRFLGTGTLAFLPLADGTSSIVWSADAGVARELLAAPVPQFEQALERESDAVLGSVRLRTERASFALQRLAAHRYTAHRCALIGDAAHVIHPLAGQGVNLGLLDAASLAEVVAQGLREREDPGAERVLRRYERWRKSETEVMALATDAFDRVLAHGSGPLARLAQRGLTWVNRSEELKRLFIIRALGLAGELPDAARV